MESASFQSASIAFPALTFNQGFVEVARSTEEFRQGSRLGIRSGAYKQLLLVDARGDAFRVADVRKIRTLAPRFKFIDFLEFAFGNPRWEVRFIFAPADPACRSLEEVKLLFKHSFKKQKDFWRETGDFAEFKLKIMKAESMERIFAVFKEFNQY